MSETRNRILRTPLSKVRGLGSAKDGTTHFWHQRLTALANVPLTLFLVYAVVTNVGASYEEMRAFVAQPLVAVSFLALVISAAIHMKLGMQIIIEDYVYSEGTKVVCLILNVFFSVGVGLAAIYAILKIGLGA